MLFWFIHRLEKGSHPSPSLSATTPNDYSKEPTSNKDCAINDTFTTKTPDIKDDDIESILSHLHGKPHK